MNKKHAGFALIEIMVVVAILSVSAAILVPRFLKHEIQKKQLECHQNLQAMLEAQRSHFEKTGQFTSDLKNLDWKQKGERYEYRFLPPPPPKNGFLFECRGNLDSDPIQDEATIDETGTFIQVVDDTKR